MSRVTVSESAVLGGGGPFQGLHLDKLVRGQARLENRMLELTGAVNTVLEFVKVSLSAESLATRAESQSRRQSRELSQTNALLAAVTEKSTESSELDTKNPTQASSLGSTSDLVSPQRQSYSPITREPRSDRMHLDRFASDGNLTIPVPRREARGPTPVGQDVFLTPYVAFQEISSAMRRTEYAQIENLLGDEAAKGALVTRISHRLYPVSISVASSVRFPLHPMSFARISFDICTVFALMLDSIMVPYFLAWGDETEGDAGRALSWIIALFWSSDLILNFCTGYIQGSNLIMRWPSIIFKYLRGFFIVDASILVIDYIELLNFANTNSGGLQFIKFLRFAKITRLVRVVVKLRSGLLARLDAMFSYRLQLYGLTSYAATINFALVMMKLLFLIAWLCHSGSCVWYYMEKQLIPASQPSWYQQFEHGEGQDWTQPWYLHGLYWTVSTMFSGASHELPSNVYEAVLSVVCVTASALFVTAVTSNLAAILIESQEATQELKKKLRALNAFMDQRGTPPLLAIAVREDFIAHMSAPARLTETDIPQLTAIKKELRTHLRHAQYSSSFLKLPFCCIVDVLSHKAQEELCANASTFMIVRAGDEIFHVNDVMSHAILLGRGSLQYMSSRASAKWSPHNAADVRRSSDSEQDADGFSVKMFQPATVAQDSWICELALFLHWKTYGNLKAEWPCELLQVDTDTFIKVVTSTPELAATSGGYSAQVAQALRDSQYAEVSDVHPGIDYDVVGANLHPSLRYLLSLPILDHLRNKNISLLPLRWRKSLAELVQEVKTGQCHLVRGPTGEEIRVVRLIVLRIFDLDNKLCVQLAECRNSANFTPKFQLPGRKILGDENDEEAIESFIEHELKPLQNHIHLQDIDMIVELVQSASFDLPTKYIKTVQNARLNGVLEPDLSYLGDMLSAASSEDGSVCAGFHHNAEDMPHVLSQPSWLRLWSNAAAPLSMTGETPSFAITSQGPRDYPFPDLPVKQPTDRTIDRRSWRTGISSIASSQVSAVVNTPKSTGSSAGDLRKSAREDTMKPTSPGSRTSIYRWMHKENFEELTGHSQGVKSMIGPYLNHLGSSPKAVQRLQRWCIRPLDAARTDSQMEQAQGGKSPSKESVSFEVLSPSREEDVRISQV